MELLSINWKIRFKQKSFLVALFSALFLLIQQVSLLFGYDLMSFKSEMEEIFNSVLMLLVLLGVVNDPTVKGFNDSEYSLSKDEPSSINVFVDEQKSNNKDNMNNNEEYNLNEGIEGGSVD